MEPVNVYLATEVNALHRVLEEREVTIELLYERVLELERMVQTESGLKRNWEQAWEIMVDKYENMRASYLMVTKAHDNLFWINRVGEVVSPVTSVVDSDSDEDSGSDMSLA